MKGLFSVFNLWISINVVSQNLLPPVTSDVRSCGADNLILTAESQINNPRLIFEWYVSSTGGPLFLGSIESVGGLSEFITPFLIKDETFFVAVRLGNESSQLVPINAVIDHEAFITEAPAIELCGDLTLTANSNFLPTDIVTYQWQVLEPRIDGQAEFIDLDGSTSRELTTSELGFYRVIITRQDECMAISSEVEVTDDQIIHATIIGAELNCPNTDNPFNHDVILESEYGRQITSFLWEESLDNTNFNPISTDQSVVINGTGTSYYRLTVSEQNCSVTSSVFPMNWLDSPVGTIAHLDPAIGTNNFFYCDTDPEFDRTLVATTTSGVDVTWLRVLVLPEGLDYVKNMLPTLDPLNSDNEGFFQWDVLASGNTIVLDQTQGGLIYAQFTDQNTGCLSYSNPIFADTVFPIYTGMTLFCERMGSLSLSSYDQTADTYSWQKNNMSNNTWQEVGTAADLFLDNPAESLMGTYRLQITKNGCIGTSEPFPVESSDFIEAIIEVRNDNSNLLDDTTICPSEQLTLSSVNTGITYGYSWMDDSGIVHGTDRSVAINTEGIYRLTVINGACSDESAPIRVEKKPSPSADFEDSIDPDNLNCEPFLIRLKNVQEGDTYQWFFSNNNLIFDPIADETNSEYFMNQAGYYYVEVVNEMGCVAISETLSVPSIVTASILPKNEVKICGESDHVFLHVESSTTSNSYKWYYSTDGVQPYVEANGDNDLTYYQAYDEGYYKVEASSESCSTFSDPTAVSLDQEMDNQNFAANISGASSACLGSLVTLSAGEEDQSNYSWYFSTDGSEYQTFQEDALNELTFSTNEFASDLQDELSVFFRVALTNNECSMLSSIHQLDLKKKPQIEIRNSLDNSTDDVFYCQPSDLSFNLELFQSVTNLNLEYEWSVWNATTNNYLPAESGDQKSYEPEAPGRYRCTVNTLGNECVVVSNEINVFTTPSPIRGSEAFCIGNNINLSIDPSSSIPQSILESFTTHWFHSLDNNTFTKIADQEQPSITIDVTSPLYGEGYYYVEIEKDGCLARSDIFPIEKDENSFDASISGVSDQSRGVPFTLYANHTSNDIMVYKWEPQEFFINASAQNVLATIPEGFEEDQITFSLEITGEGGCMARASFQSFISDVSKIIFPNLLTLNGDGLNDEFKIIGLDITEKNSLSILNSWGTPVYQTHNYYNQSAQVDTITESLVEGVYYYFFTSEEKKYKGSFYVTR